MPQALTLTHIIDNVITREFTQTPAEKAAAGLADLGITVDQLSEFRRTYIGSKMSAIWYTGTWNRLRCIEAKIKDDDE